MRAEKSYLELRGKVYAGKKAIDLPSKKVTDGANTTYMLVKRTGNVAFKADNYQETLSSTTEGQIKYLVNSSEVRGSELKGSSVKDFVAALEAVQADERSTVTSTEIPPKAAQTSTTSFPATVETAPSRHGTRLPRAQRHRPLR